MRGSIGVYCGTPFRQSLTVSRIEEAEFLQQFQWPHRTALLQGSLGGGDNTLMKRRTRWQLEGSPSTKVVREFGRMTVTKREGIHRSLFATALFEFLSAAAGTRFIPSDFAMRRESWPVVVQRRFVIEVFVVERINV